MRTLLGRLGFGLLGLQCGIHRHKCCPCDPLRQPSSWLCVGLAAAWGSRFDMPHSSWDGGSETRIGKLESWWRGYLQKPCRRVTASLVASVEWAGLEMNPVSRID